MLRSLFAFVCAFGLALSAQALSVEIVPDQSSYLPGDTVTLSVVVDPTGVPGSFVLGDVAYDPTILLGGASVQNPLSSLGVPWDVSAELLCGGGSCEAFGQSIDILIPIPVDQPPGFIIATMTFTAGAPGTTEVTWSALSFFGLGVGDASGATVNVVPEPASSALIAAGLFALAAARRGRSKGGLR